MSFFSIISSIIFKPLLLVFEAIYSLAAVIFNNHGISIIFLSIAINLLVLPLYNRADTMQEEEREIEKRLNPGVKHIKKTFKGDERTMMLQAYYRQNNYSPLGVLKGAVSLFLEIPFFIAAYNFLSGLESLTGVSFGPITDLSRPDGLLTLFGITINVLPVLMTAVNLVSSAIFTKGHPLKAKLQLYGMALFFLVFLYNSPSGLVFYWTLNNVFSLIKTIIIKLKLSLKSKAYVISVLGILLTLLCMYEFFLADDWKRGLCFGILGGITIIIAFMLLVIIEKPIKQKTYAPNKKLFIACTLLLAVLVGYLIPSQLITSSPDEFITTVNGVQFNPLWYLVSSLAIALGLFVLWLGVFYKLAGDKGKVYFERLVFILCGIFLIDYLFFGRNLGILTSDLSFETGLAYTVLEIFINSASVIWAIILLLYIVKKVKKHLTKVISVVVASLVLMSGINTVAICKNKGTAATDATSPFFTLSKTGKNVVVIMLDRAIGMYIPYIFNEHPELEAQFSGFTYYHNTVSFGGYTNFATPAFYGGYEYTPVEINKRSNEKLSDKQTEALKVMPTLFASAGYDVTVFDPTYANYNWTPDISIYDDYENIRAFNTYGRFTLSTTAQSQINARLRNFFCYGLMKSSPIGLQYPLYASGKYNQVSGVPYSDQVSTSASTASGISTSFIDAYNVLVKLPELTQYVDSANGSFLMMSNDTTHNPILLQEPECEPKTSVNNTEYDNANKSRFTLDDGSTITAKSALQLSHYQSNTAALMKIGAWLDELKANGVYDNTRIIVASDHGRELGQSEELEIYGLGDMELFCPLLLVKDFNSTEFTVSEEFMTNADVPVLALSGIVENPVNPFTGKAINSDEKYAHEQFIIESDLWNVNKNNGNCFASSSWLAVKDSIWDKSNWRRAGSNVTMPS